MAEQSSTQGQLALLRSRVRRGTPKPVAVAAPELPIARVAVDLPLAHLDRPFDYLVTEPMHQQVAPGCRVKVRFAGRDVDGFVLDRVADTEHPGRLSPLRRVVSAEPVLTPEVAAVARLVADRYAGSLADVLRLAVPPRHARVEAEDSKPTQARLDVPLEHLMGRWSAEVGGAAMVARLADRQGPRAVWQALPGADWEGQLAAAAAATLRSGRGSILCVPSSRDATRLGAAVTALLGGDAHIVLTADLGPASRYRAFLAASRGRAQIVVGTRAAAFAPVRRLGLVAVWDDGDDLHAEPRAPYPHAREVLLLRAFQEQTAALIGGHGRSVEGQALVESGWAVSLAPPRSRLRESAPQIHVAGESDRELERDSSVGTARMPRRVFEVVRDALVTGPVLVHVPRYGYQPALACSRCRQPARCVRCIGPLGRPRGGAAPSCRWCGAVVEGWSCQHCRGVELRAPVVGSLRTAEEWGRAFPQTTVVSSGGDHVVDEVPDKPAVVVATPGAEPHADSGYAAAVLLDTWLTSGLPGLRASEEAMRRWVNIGALVRSAGEGGRVVAVGDPADPVLQALVRWDPVGLATRELVGRESARLTPAARLATVTGPADSVAEVMAALDLPRQAEVLGPVEIGDGRARIVVRTGRERGAGLSRALQHLQAARSARKLPPVRVQVDPADLG
ncbi:MAG: primosomal protein N' [Nocardioidaceae bacterium]|nr:primosomal protein N' [Nocardioidaceae bacterium]